MKQFNNQLELTMYWEGFKSTAYRCPAGVITIGYGMTSIDGKPVTEGMTCTQEQAMGWLEAELFDLDVWVYGNITRSTKYCKENIHDALSDYAYNAGKNAFPTLLKKLKAGDTQGAILEFLDGIYVAKKPLLGLLLRRISEYNTFVNGTYIAWEKGDPISQDLKNKLLAKNAKNQDAVNMINQLKVK